MSGGAWVEAYERDGWCRVPAVAGPCAVAQANAVADRILAADYATGTAPLGVNWRPGEDPTRLVKIDQPQLADPAVVDLFTASRIGEVAAALTGASMVQVWAVQLLHKAPATAATTWGKVGWHQDDDYWHDWWDGEVFTCWVALGDVTAEHGPVRFVPGSHRWGWRGAGDFFVQDLDGVAAAFPVPEGATWAEEPALLAAGDASFHHRHTVHGSGLNTAATPRRGYAVHLRTERSSPLPAAPASYLDRIDDPAVCPVLVGA